MANQVILTGTKKCNSWTTKISSQTKESKKVFSNVSLIDFRYDATFGVIAYAGKRNIGNKWNVEQVTCEDDSFKTVQSLAWPLLWQQ